MCLGSLLDLIQAVHETVNSLDSCSDPSLLTSARLRLVLSDDGADATVGLDLPEDLYLRQQILTSLKDLASRWIENSMFQVPSQTLSVLQLYIHDVQQRDSSPTSVHDHSGVSLALGLVVATKKITRLDLSLQSRPGTADFSSSQLLASLCMRQRYLGEIRGRFAAFSRERIHSLEHGRDSGLDSEGYFGEIQSALLLKEFQLVLARYRAVTRNPDSDDDPDIVQIEFERCMFMAAALLVWSSQILDEREDDRLLDHMPDLENHCRVEPRELMHLLCMAPVHVFNTVTMQTAVLVWGWLFTVSHALAIGVLVTMKSSWAYTVENGIGLFSGTESPCLFQFDGCLFTVQGSKPVLTEAKPRKSPPHVAAPHDLWIQFLLERFDTLRDRSLGSLRIVESMMHKALARPERLTCAQGTFGCRFRLLYLGQRMVHSAWEQGLMLREDLEMLRDRIYSTAFAWFTEAPQWSAHSSTAEVEQEASTIVAFIQALNADVSPSHTLVAPATERRGSGNHSVNDTASVAQLTTHSGGSGASTVGTTQISSTMPAATIRTNSRDPVWARARSAAQLLVASRRELLRKVSL